MDHGSNHIVILIDFLHPPVTWHLFPQSEFETTSSKAAVGYLAHRHYPLVMMSISVGILLDMTGDSH